MHSALFRFIALVGSFTGIRLFLKQWLLRRKIRQWHQALAIKAHQTIHKNLYASVNGFTLSRQARLHRDAIEYTYGEIEFTSFIALLSLTTPSKNTVFYDFGSGVGHTVLACAMVFQVKKSCGIELFKELFDASLSQQARLLNLPNYHWAAQSIHFIHSNFLEVDVRDATHIFINGTTLFGDSWAALNQHLSQVASQTIVITTSKPLSNPYFMLKNTVLVQMSWGIVNAYIHVANPPVE